MKKLKVGIIGCGNISGIYMKNLTQVFDNIEIYACSDLIDEKAEKCVKEYNIPNKFTADELINDPLVDIVLNLTTPPLHTEINQKAIKAGKHVYVEKPLAVDLIDGINTVKLAKDNNVYVGCAPDTFLGGGLQTCRKLIDDGIIGKPIAAIANMVCHGHESWHPDPEFYYKVGGGPMFDMGPYYLTALVSLIGPVKKVAGLTGKSFDARIITSENKYGTKIKVEVPTHVTGSLQFENGAIGTMITSFDIWDSKLPKIEIYGTKGTMIVPDPNTFGGPIFVKTSIDTEWKEIPLLFGFEENSRGLGLSEMADSIIKGRHNIACGDLALHVLEIMHGFHISSDNDNTYKTESMCERPTPLNI